MIEIDKKLHKDIKEYCQLNGIVMKDFVNKLLKKAFAVEKYGEKPFVNSMPKTLVTLPIAEVSPEIQEVTDNHYFDMLDNKEIENTSPKCHEDKISQRESEKEKIKKSKKRKL